MNPTLHQIIDISNVTVSENSTLNSDYHLCTRSRFVHFLRWLVSVLTAGYVSPNPKLDLLVQKIHHVAEDALLQLESLDGDQRNGLLEAMDKVILISKQNFGRNHRLLEQLEEDWIFQDSSNSEKDLDLEEQIKQVQKIDTLASPNTWKTGLGKQEVEQTLEDFQLKPITQVNAQRTQLKVVAFGQVSNSDRTILKIIADYLQATHGIETTFDPSPVPLDEAHMRHKFHHPQYACSPQLDKLVSLQPNNTFSIGFTDQDIYPHEFGNQINFIFGVGEPNSASGIFSIKRFKAANFEKTLKRLMELASHEFAHMRGMLHCTKYSCNMEGSNSLEESDRIPLTLCALDMAKICHLNNWSLKEGYKNQLKFFRDFFEHYHVKVDFTSEIADLKKKIIHCD
jgi:archaemetzincin